MIFPDVPVDEWAKKYGIEKETSVCAKCKAEIRFDTPFVSKFGRGLTTSHLDCGQGYRQFVFRPNDQDFWMEVLGGKP